MRGACLSLLLLPASALALPKNYGVVTAKKLHRSAQPSLQDMREMKQRGLKVVISLRQSNVPQEKADALKAGLYFINIPIPNHGNPTPQQVFLFMGIMANQQHQPALVHCAKGKGRTGVLVALYRTIMEGAKVDAALAEARRYGLTSDKQIKFVKDFTKKHFETAAGPGWPPKPRTTPPPAGSNPS